MNNTSHILRFRRSRKDRNRSNPLGRIGLILAGLISLAAASGAIFLVDRYAEITRDLPSPERIEILLNPQSGSLLEPTRIVARGGEVELWRFENPAIGSRRYLSITDGSMLFYRDLTEDFLNAILAAHDPDFLNRPDGFLACMMAGDPDPITRAVVDELLLWNELDHPDYPSRAKLISCQLTSTYGRKEILEWFLNSAYFGHQIYGSAQAASYYFGKALVEIDLAESALLAAVSKYPALTPLDSPSAAKENQERILAEMAAVGSITDREQDEAGAVQLILASREDLQTLTTPAYVDLILSELLLTIPEDRLLRGGYQIISTIDPQLQSALECTAGTYLEQVYGRTDLRVSDCDAARLIPGYQGPVLDQTLPLELDLVLYDPGRGEILALAGLTDPASTPDLQHPRNPGSLITPYLYLNEFAKGFEPASLVWDIPAEGPLSAADLHPSCGEECQFSGPVNIRTAIANDLLSPAVELWSAQSGNQIQNTLTAFGFSLDGEACEDCSVFPGIPKLDLVDLVQGFGVFSSTGYLTGISKTDAGLEIQPRIVERLEDWSGEEIALASSLTTQKIISDELAYLVNHTLMDAEARLDPADKDRFQIGRPAAVKTGFVPGEASAWTIGYTPQYTIGIWAGSPQGADPGAADYQQITSNLWRGITQFVSRDLPNLGWDPPANILMLDVCYPSGLLPTENCPRTAREVFIRGNEPVGMDDLYQAREINRETGLLASVFTPVGQIEERVFLNIPQEAADWAEKAGLPIQPTLYDLDVPDLQGSGLELTSPENFSFIRGRIGIAGFIPEDEFVTARLQYGAGMNPGSWLQIGSEISQPGTQRRLASWDTTGLEDGIYALQLVVILERQQIQKFSLVVSVDNTPPEINLANWPEGGRIQYQRGEDYLFEVRFDNPSEIDQVVFEVDGDQAAYRTFPPFIYPWTLKVGEHQLQITARDQAGNLAEFSTSFHVMEGE